MNLYGLLASDLRQRPGGSRQRLVETLVGCFLRWWLQVRRKLARAAARICVAPARPTHGMSGRADLLRLVRGGMEGAEEAQGPGSGAGRFGVVDGELLAWRVASVEGFTGGPVHSSQRRQAVTPADSVSGGRGDACASGRPQRADPVPAPQPDDLLLHHCRRAARLVVRTAGAVFHPHVTLHSVAAGPACSCRVADLEPFRGTAQRPAVIHDAPGQTQPAGRH